MQPEICSGRFAISVRITQFPLTRAQVTKHCMKLCESLKRTCISTCISKIMFFSLVRWRWRVQTHHSIDCWLHWNKNCS